MERKQLNSVQEQLASFESTSLTDMQSVSLMDRIDTKFIFERSKLLDVLLAIKPDYKCLEINESRIAKYKTDYFDTFDYGLYTAHHNKKQGRYKIRFREYVESKISFLEVKYKSNKGKTYKSRIPEWIDGKSVSTKGGAFLQKKTPYNRDVIKHTLTNRFSRITLVNKSREERLTIDFSLMFGNDEKRVDLDNLVVLEVKQGKLDRTSEVMLLMKSNRIHQASFSKYATGAAILYSTLKYNNFKSNLLYLNKIHKNGNIWNPDN